MFVLAVTVSRVAGVGWIAGAVLIAGIWSRMVFAFAHWYRARPAVASFSYTHQIRRRRVARGAGVDRAARGPNPIAIVQLRGRHAIHASADAIAAVA